MKRQAKFRSDAFNTSEPREYFINDCCFGDDLCRWLMRELAARGVTTDEEPGQEDFGWYFGFHVDGIAHCAVTTYMPREALWLLRLDRDRGLLGSLFGMRRSGLSPEAPRVIHRLLAASPQNRTLTWHERFDFQDLFWADPDSEASSSQPRHP